MKNLTKLLLMLVLTLAATIKTAQAQTEKLVDADTTIYAKDHKIYTVVRSVFKSEVTDTLINQEKNERTLIKNEARITKTDEKLLYNVSFSKEINAIEKKKLMNTLVAKLKLNLDNGNFGVINDKKNKDKDFVLVTEKEYKFRFLDLFPTSKYIDILGQVDDNDLYLKFRSTYDVDYTRTIAIFLFAFFLAIVAWFVFMSGIVIDKKSMKRIVISFIFIYLSLLFAAHDASIYSIVVFIVIIFYLLLEIKRRWSLITYLIKRYRADDVYLTKTEREKNNQQFASSKNIIFTCICLNTNTKNTGLVRLSDKEVLIEPSDNILDIETDVIAFENSSVETIHDIASKNNYHILMGTKVVLVRFFKYKTKDGFYVYYGAIDEETGDKLLNCASKRQCSEEVSANVKAYGNILRKEQSI